MEYLKTLWRETKTSQKVFAAVVALFLMALASKAEVTVTDADGWIEQRYSGEDLICEPASNYAHDWDTWGAQFGDLVQVNSGEALDVVKGPTVWALYADAAAFGEATYYVVGGFVSLFDEVCVLAIGKKSDTPPVNDEAL